MINTKTKNTLLTGVILLVAFLLQTPLYPMLYSAVPALGMLINLSVRYVAMLVCVVLVTKPFLNAANFFKAFGVIVAYAAFDSILQFLAFNAVLAISFEILFSIMPMLAIYLAAKLIANQKMIKDIKLFALTAVTFVLKIVFTVLSFIRSMQLMQSFENGEMSLLQLFDLSNNGYDVAIEFCTYLMIFTAVIYTQKCIDKDRSR